MGQESVGEAGGILNQPETDVSAKRLNFFFNDLRKKISLKLKYVEFASV